MVTVTVAGYADDELSTASDPASDPLAARQAKQVPGCPSATLINPCTCAPSSNYTGTVDIVCSGNNIGNDRMQEIIANVTATTAIGKLDLTRTSLTKVPPGLTKFTTISELYLGGGNTITTIGTGELCLNSSTLQILDLSVNLIGTIENASLPRMYIVV